VGAFDGVGHCHLEPDLTMPKKMVFWKKENPVAPKDRTTLTPDQKAAAKARAKASGRPYPNLVDNAAVARKAKER
jgi:hypothetical protein